METRASYVMVGFVVLASFMALIAFALWLGRSQFEDTQERYIVRFQESVTGLVVGSPVRYSGISIGTVESLQIDPDDPSRVRVVVAVRAGTPITEGAFAQLELQGITGGLYIQIAGGRAGAGALVAAEGETYPEIPAQRSQLGAIVQTVPDLLTQVHTLVSRVSDVLSEDNQRSITEILISVQTLTEGLVDQSRSVGETVERVNRLVTNLDALAVSVDSQVNRLGDDMSRAVGASEQELRAVARSVRTAADAFGTASSQVGALIGGARPGLEDFADSGLYELTLAIGELRLLAQNLSRVSLQLERGGGANFLFGNAAQGRETVE